jgi:hypothetical protein
MDHVVKNCPLKRRKHTIPAKTVNNPPSPADNNNADPNLDREDQTQSDLDALHQNGPDLPENTAQPMEVKTLPETTATRFQNQKTRNWRCRLSMTFYKTSKAVILTNFFCFQRIKPSKCVPFFSDGRWARIVRIKWTHATTNPSSKY